MDDLEKRFTFHPAKNDQPLRYTQIRYEALDLAKLIDDLAPDSREKSLAITHLEDAVMWANAAIARNELWQGSSRSRSLSLRRKKNPRIPLKQL